MTSSTKTKKSEKPQTQKRKASLHPNYRKIKVIMTNGDEFYVRSTHQQDVLKLDIDVHTHRAWTKDMSNLNKNVNEVEKFNKRFGDIDLFSGVK